MDNLTWFKFSPAQWYIGKIQRCSEVTQARYIRLCCLYWNKECNLSVEDAEIEIDKDHFDILVAKKIVKVIGDSIDIQFLNEQMDGIIETSKGKSKAAKARWDKYKKDKASAMQKDADAMHLHKDAMQNDADKIRVDKSRVEETRGDKKRTDKKLNNNSDKKSPFMDELKFIYLNWYESEKFMPFIWSAKDDKALGGMVSKIKKLHEGNSTPAETVKEFFSLVLNNLPEFNKDRACEPTQINGQFNSIVTQIKSNNQTSSNEFNYFS